VPILNESSHEERKRLLDLLPIANLRQAWPDLIGPKEEICGTIAGGGLDNRVTSFVDENFGCCKQHVFIYGDGSQRMHLPTNISSAERIATVRGVHSLFLTRQRYDVVLKDPLEAVSLNFLWPIRTDVVDNYLVVRFITLEKNLKSYLPRAYLPAGQSISESDILDNLDLTPADIHKGIKALWAAGFMDCCRAKYKKAKSIAWEAMDEQKGIREHNPELYSILKKATLQETLFLIPKDQDTSVSALLADPAEGYIAFPRYSERKGDTDHVIRNILEKNQ
jgi:hypothetical protein